MIVAMRKIFVVGRLRDQERLLEAIRDEGAVHLIADDPSRAVPDDQTRDRVRALQRALQVLHGIAPQGAPPDISPVEAAYRVLEIEQRSAECNNRLASLNHQLAQIELWGNMKLEWIESLQAAGVDVQFVALPAVDVPKIESPCSAYVGELSDGRVVVALAARRSASSDSTERTDTAETAALYRLPESAAAVPLPPRDAPSIRAEAARVEAVLRDDTAALAQLAHLAVAMEEELLRQEQQAEFSAALRGGLERDELFAVQGWCPVDRTATLAQRLQAAGIVAAVRWFEPTDEEQPPTLIRTPFWARPIEGLFQILGTVAGYREFDVSIPFLIALPIFSAILIGDGGYGALLLLTLTLGYRHWSKMLGPQFTQLMIIISSVTLGWGLICATFFGATLYKPLITVDLSEASRNFMMRMSFIMGAVHLSLAQLWQAVRLFPDLRVLNKIGWAVFIWGMFGLVQFFVLKTRFDGTTPWPYFLAVGATLSILFHYPSRNPLKMIGFGLGAFPLSMLSAFSDVISYVRLMAVGLASSVLGVSFNQMAMGLDNWALSVPILLFGHGLNIALAMIAMFAHGVRLNMLEFCGHLGMQWTGYAFSPFSKRMIREQ